MINEHVNEKEDINLPRVPGRYKNEIVRGKILKDVINCT